MMNEKSAQATKNRLKKVKAVLFDLDGTVIDTIDLIRSSFRHATTQVLGQSLPDEVLLQNLGTPLLDQMKVFSPEKAEELVKVYREHNQAHHDRMVKEYPDVVTVLTGLKKKGYRLAIVTSKSGPLARRGLEVLGLGPYFEVLVSMDDTTEHKPLPAPILAALQKLGCGPDEAVYIGDSPHDLRAGKAAGVLTAAALWGPFPLERLLAEKPDLVLDKMTDLLEIL
jgi:pyrophosphatase PpaX